MTKNFCWPLTSDDGPVTPHQDVPHFSAFSALSAMVLLDNTLRDDAKIGSASLLHTGCAQAREPVGGVYPRRRVGIAMTRASASGNGDSRKVPDSIEGHVRADCAKLGCNLAASVGQGSALSGATGQFSLPRGEHAIHGTGALLGVRAMGGIFSGSDGGSWPTHGQRPRTRPLRAPPDWSTRSSATARNCSVM